MTENRQGAERIVIMARPALSRTVEKILSPAGYETHRTPDDLQLVQLVLRLRADLVLIALDLPWTHAKDAAIALLEHRRSVPIVLLGDHPNDPRLNHVPCLPLPLNATLLLATVAAVLAVGDTTPN
jgi:DNA-binding response OmpR family regulator